MLSSLTSHFPSRERGRLGKYQGVVRQCSVPRYTRAEGDGRLIGTSKFFALTSSSRM